MSKLSNKQKAQIIEDRVNGMSFRLLADKYKCSTTTIQRVVKGNPDMSQKVIQKKEEDISSVFQHMDSKKNDVCLIIDKLLAEIGDEEKIKNTSLSQLATTMGIVIDKFTKTENIESVEDISDDGFVNALNNKAEELKWDEKE